SHDLSTDSLVTLMDFLLNEIQTKSPETKLYIQSLLPINESFGRYKKLTGKTDQIPEINAKLKELANRRNIVFIDLFPLFTEDKTNILDKKITTDGLHLNEDGYKIWVKKLKEYLADH
ncbi:MAG TPA: GDSL-type esterase/lipase family protein, partial [Paludibacteraceae bacterium]|nr:GDSL-type esterase/lipase family protein [Paludibacteraceae bacterium]